mmetsp:Transcript_56869/g.133333  ORF Transcript_56869/g.133333 Transcript_56869/m.133333 type:complete len:215 (-) Transcript_56869:1981-2625(-)
MSLRARYLGRLAERLFHVLDDLTAQQRGLAVAAHDLLSEVDREQHCRLLGRQRRARKLEDGGVGLRKRVQVAACEHAVSHQRLRPLGDGQGLLVLVHAAQLLLLEVERLLLHPNGHHQLAGHRGHRHRVRALVDRAVGASARLLQADVELGRLGLAAEVDVEVHLGRGARREHRHLCERLQFHAGLQARVSDLDVVHGVVRRVLESESDGAHAV